jgi:diguanylate cyclase (GGDEF)-like protein
VNAVCLEQDDLVLSRQEKLEKARSLLFDAEYQLTKSIIYDHLDLFTQKVMLMTKDNLTDGLDYLSQSIHTHRMLLSILIGLNLVTFFVITLLVVKPLKIFLECVQSQTLFHPTGAYEFKYLAHVYNDIYQRSDSLAASEAHLRQKAEHDGLTGILNRYMFQKVCALLSDSTAPLALVLIDVDKFKNINDTYGHTAGDQVLIRVAQTLKDNLRGSDYVFRIGGDEFAAILPEVTGDNVVAVCNKLLRINEGLQTPDGTVPGVSLSIGITLSEHGYHDALYKQANTALYWIKKHGRCGCMVYKEELENNQ